MHDLNKTQFSLRFVFVSFIYVAVILATPVIGWSLAFGAIFIFTVGLILAVLQMPLFRLIKRIVDR